MYVPKGPDSFIINLIAFISHYFIISYFIISYSFIIILDFNVPPQQDQLNQKGKRVLQFSTHKIEARPSCSNSG